MEKELRTLEDVRPHKVGEFIKKRNRLTQKEALDLYPNAIRYRYTHPRWSVTLQSLNQWAIQRSVKIVFHRIGIKTTTIIYSKKSI